jgi:hypothetical protein
VKEELYLKQSDDDNDDDDDDDDGGGGEVLLPTHARTHVRTRTHFLSAIKLFAQAVI